MVQAQNLLGLDQKMTCDHWFQTGHELVISWVVVSTSTSTILGPFAFQKNTLSVQQD